MEPTVSRCSEERALPLLDRLQLAHGFAVCSRARSARSHGSRDRKVPRYSRRRGAARRALAARFVPCGRCNACVVSPDRPGSPVGSPPGSGLASWLYRPVERPHETARWIAGSWRTERARRAWRCTPPRYRWSATADHPLRGSPATVSRAPASETSARHCASRRVSTGVSPASEGRSEPRSPKLAEGFLFLVFSSKPSDHYTLRQ